MRSKKKGIIGEECQEFSTAEGQGLAGVGSRQGRRQLEWTLLNASPFSYRLRTP